MGKVSKSTKNYCRCREVKQEKIDKLYEKVQERCKDCQCACCNDIAINIECKNRIERKYNLNEIIQILKDENINMTKFCSDYNLKINIWIDMLRANLIMSYKYYICFLDRIGEVKNEFEINENYQNGEFFDGNIKERKNIDNEDGGFI